jgi:hypothetical protein
MMLKAAGFAVALSVSVALAAAPACAEGQEVDASHAPPPGRAGSCGDPQAVEDRLDVLADAFDDQIRGLDIWSFSWGGIYGTLAISEGIVAATMSGDNPGRIDIVFGAIAAGVGAVSFMILPMRLTVPLRHVRTQWADPDRCGLLFRAEQVRQHVADEQRVAKSWLGHAGNLLVNLGIALTFGLVLHHWEAGLISAGVGLAVGELNLLSQPAKLWKVQSPAMRLVPVVSKDFTGAGFALAF